MTLLKSNQAETSTVLEVKGDANYYWADIDTTHVISHIDKLYNVQFSAILLIL